MTLNTSDEEVIAARRHRVARLRLRNATQREIAQTLSCSLGTVNGDLAALRQEWREAAAVDIADHQARVLAELQEVRRMAWAQPAGKGLPLVLQSLKQECALLGLDMQPGTLMPGNLEITLRWHDDNRHIIDITPAANDHAAAAPQLAESGSTAPGAVSYRVRWAEMGQEPASSDAEPENSA
jgi:hypothetical protein